MIIASIDIGTNTVILLIAEIDAAKGLISPLYNEQRIPRLGKNIHSSKSISKAKINELIQILQDYDKAIRSFNCEKTFITATNALRIASNKNEIKRIIKNELNLEINIVSGEQEADLTFNGAAYQFNDDSKSLVIDIGGGSTEIIYGKKSDIIYKKSYQIGVVAAKEKFFRHSPPLPSETLSFQNELKRVFNDLKKEHFIFDRAIAIAGTPTTLAAIKLNLSEYNEELLEGLKLNRNEIMNLLREIKTLKDADILKKYKAMVKGREDVILSGAVILLFLMELLYIDEVIVSTKGIRYGVIYNELFI